MIVISYLGADGEGGRPYHDSAVPLSVNLIVDLPHDASAAILNSWLSLPDVCGLDSAMCNHDKRNALLELLYSSGVFRCVKFSTNYDLGQKIMLTNSYLAWICLRGVKLDGFEATCSMFEFDLLLQYVRNYGSSLCYFCFSLNPFEE